MFAKAWVDSQHDAQRDRIVAACEQDARDQNRLRTVLLGLTVRLGTDLETAAAVRDYLDERYPELDPTRCIDLTLTDVTVIPREEP